MLKNAAKPLTYSVLNVRSMGLAAIAALLFAFSGDARAACLAPVASSTDEGQMAVADLDVGVDEYDRWVTTLEREWGQKLGEFCEGRALYVTRSQVEAKPADRNYGKWLVMAYERAMLELQAKYASEMYGRLLTEKTQGYLSDASSNAREIEPLLVTAEREPGNRDTHNELLNKAIQLIGARLDSELVKNGVPADIVNKETVQQKKQILKDNFRRDTIIKAVGTVSGLVPIQTRIFAGKNQVGEYAEIAVAAVVSQRARLFAEDMARKRPTLLRGSPQAINDVLPKTKDEYLNEIGLRYIHNDNGVPMLLSYGRWSVADKTDDPRKFQRFINNAKETAEIYAKGYIAEFIRVDVETKEQTTQNQAIEEWIKRESEIEGKRKVVGQREFQSDIANLIDIRNKEVKTRAESQLRGTSTLRTWEQTDKNGILHVGAVVTWSFEKLQNQNELERAPSAASSPLKTLGPGVYEDRTSKPVNRPRDF